MNIKESFPTGHLLNKRFRYSFSRLPEILPMPSLIDLQEKSYEEFLQKDVQPHQRKNKGLQGALTALFPIQDFSGRAQLEFESYTLENPKHDIEESRYKGLTYAAPMRAKVRLVIWDNEGETRTIRSAKEQEIYLGDIPLMTGNGTFIINGVERVVVSQMHRSPGVFFDHDKGAHTSGKYLFLGRIIPFQGSWIDFEFDVKDLLYVRIDRKRKFLVTTLLLALGKAFDKESRQFTEISREELLQTFYKTLTYKYEHGKWEVSFIPQMWKGVTLEENLIDARSGEVKVEAGTKLSVKALKKLQDEGLQFIEVNQEKVCGRYLSSDMINAETGEIFAEAGEEITKDLLTVLANAGITEIDTLDIDHSTTGAYLRNTLMADKNMTQEEALFEIYRILRPGETPSLDSAKNLFYNLFFNPDRYNLSDVGRVKLNICLDLDTDLSVHTLQPQDIIGVVRLLLNLKDGKGSIDDVDSLANRRVRSVGELLEAQYRAGLLRMKRSVSERMVAIDLDQAMPNDLLNVRPLSAIIREFFCTSQLSQFMDQTNPLSEVNHKRRISSLGPSGLTRERAGFEVRDVHPTHYGRICPIESPEGANIGLISSLAIYARVNRFGFLETPYRRVENGQLTDEIVYVSSIEEEKYVIAQSDVTVDEQGFLKDEMVGCRHAGNNVLVAPKDIHFADVSLKQIVSVAAALIPFIENDDATRALMGANMQRQAVPLLKAKAPLIGTGVEEIVGRDSGALIRAERDGIVDQVDARRIVVRATQRLSKGKSVVDIYTLEKFQRSNAGTCIHQRPRVSAGQKIKAGDVIADAMATELGELALGSNVLVAFMSWRGYGFEDSIILSQRLVKEDAYTSIHVDEFEVSARDMRLGYEEITRDIPGANEEVLRHLDEAGVAYIGAEVRPGDVLVGKISPKAEAPLTPEEKLLRAIFSDKASDVKDTSLRVPPGVSGTVVDVRIFSRRGVEKDERALSIDREEIARLAKDRETEKKILEHGFDKVLKDIAVGSIVVKGSGVNRVEAPLTEEEWVILKKPEKLALTFKDEAVIEQIFFLKEQHNSGLLRIREKFERKVDKINIGDDLPTGVLKTVKIFIAVKRKIQPGDKMAGRHGNKGVVSMIVPVEDMPYLEDGTPIDMILNPLGLPSRMNIGQILETHLGWVSTNLGKKARKFFEDVAGRELKEKEGVKEIKKGLKDLYLKPELCEKIDKMKLPQVMELARNTCKGLPMACPVFEGARVEEIKAWLEKAGCNSSGQEILYDGYTGEAFDRPITVGIVYMLKLHHLVDEKIHARSVGPYSLVTQQPLGGKAQFGGQRLGEMEVWALEAYGAAYILQEMLTVKSDDVVGRTKVYEAIIKGNESFGSGIPESFNVLVKELRTLGLNVECYQDAIES